MAVDVTTVTKHFELRGRNERDLEDRIDTFRQALAVQNGVLLHVEWNGRTTRSACSASVIYRVPLTAMKPRTAAA